MPSRPVSKRPAATSKSSRAHANVDSISCHIFGIKLAVTGRYAITVIAVVAVIGGLLYARAIGLL